MKDKISVFARPRQQGRIKEMTDYMEKALADIEAMKAKIAEIEKTIKAEREAEWPRLYDKYYFHGSWGDVSVCKFLGDAVDKGRFAIGNYFKTEEDAEFAVERLKVIAELKKFARPFKHGEDNYYCYFDFDLNDVSLIKEKFYPSGNILFFDSKKTAQQAIAAVGEDRIKKYYFGVAE